MIKELALATIVAISSTAANAELTDKEEDIAKTSAWCMAVISIADPEPMNNTTFWKYARAYKDIHPNQLSMDNLEDWALGQLYDPENETAKWLADACTEEVDAFLGEPT